MAKQLNHLIHTFLVVIIIELILLLYSILPEIAGKKTTVQLTLEILFFSILTKLRSFWTCLCFSLYSTGLHICWAAEALQENPLAIYSLYKSPADAVYNTPLNSWLSFAKLRRELRASARLLCPPKDRSIWLRLLLYSPDLDRESRSSFLFFFSSVLLFFVVFSASYGHKIFNQKWEYIDYIWSRLKGTELILTGLVKLHLNCPKAQICYVFKPHCDGCFQKPEESLDLSFSVWNFKFFAHVAVYLFHSALITLSHCLQMHMYSKSSVHSPVSQGQLRRNN